MGLDTNLFIMAASAAAALICLGSTSYFDPFLNVVEVKLFFLWFFINHLTILSWPAQKNFRLEIDDRHHQWHKFFVPRVSGCWKQDYWNDLLLKLLSYLQLSFTIVVRNLSVNHVVDKKVTEFSKTVTISACNIQRWKCMRCQK